MGRLLDVTSGGVGALARRWVRTLAAIIAVAVSISGIVLVAGHALARRQAIDEMMYTMCDLTLMRVRKPSVLESKQRRHLKRDHLRLADAEKLQGIPGVGLVVPYIASDGVAKYGREVADITIMGGDPSLLRALGYEVGSGRSYGAKSSEECLVTPTAAKAIFGEEDPLGKSLRLKGWLVTVVGIAQSRRERNSARCFVSFQLAQQISRVSYPDGIVVRVADGAAVEQVRRSIETALSQLLGSDVGSSMVSSEADSFRDQVKLLGNDLIAEAVFLFLGVIIAVATVAELLYAGVQADLREIGLLRAVGATRLDVAWRVIAQGMVLCLIGGFVGLMLTQSYHLWPEWLRSQFRWVWSPRLISVSVVISLVAGVLASVLPAWAAAQAEPATVVRDDA